MVVGNSTVPIWQKRRDILHAVGRHPHQRNLLVGMISLTEVISDGDKSRSLWQCHFYL
jgi:hypothetical protein